MDMQHIFAEDENGTSPSSRNMLVPDYSVNVIVDGRVLLIFNCTG